MTRDHHETCLPADQFYWAALDLNGARRPLGRSARRNQLEYLLETFLPEPLDGVHTAFVPDSEGRIIACGMDRTKLADSNSAVALGPEEIPPFLGSNLDPGQFNLLDGEFEPAVLKRARNRWIAVCCLLLAAATAFVVIGMNRRTLADARLSQELGNAAGAMIASVLPSGYEGAQTSHLRLISERRRLEQTREAPFSVLDDVSTAMAGLLSVWPTELIAQTQSIVVTGSVATVIANVSSNEDAQHLASALDASPNWRAQQPQVRQQQNAVQLTLRLDWTGDAP